MPIRRTTLQSGETLEEFYQQSIWKDSFKVTSDRMLDLMALINQHFIKTDIIATTSHQRLCIHREGDEEMNWVIIIAHSPLLEFHFEFRVPSAKSPWKDAWMAGTCSSVQEAFVYLLISMNQTELWEGNDELARLSISFISPSSNETDG